VVGLSYVAASSYAGKSSPGGTALTTTTTTDTTTSSSTSSGIGLQPSPQVPTTGSSGSATVTSGGS
jgi:hypothetical protein